MSCVGSLRDVISVFSAGGKILTEFLGGAKYKEKIFCMQKHKKITIFLIQGGQIPPCPPEMTSLGSLGRSVSKM